MNKYQEAFNIMQGYYIITHRDVESEEIKTLKELVDKETPMKPKDEGVWFCPICDSCLYSEKEKYCPYCGQKLDWGDE